jgi:hypothetical protein
MLKGCGIIHGVYTLKIDRISKMEEMRLVFFDRSGKLSGIKSVE